MTAHPFIVFILVKLYVVHMTSNIKSVTYNIKKLHPTHLVENTPYLVPNSNIFTNRALKLNWSETKLFLFMSPHIYIYTYIWGNGDHQKTTARLLFKQQKQLYAKPDFWSAWRLPNHHWHQIKWGFLKTKAWLCCEFSSVTHNSQAYMDKLDPEALLSSYGFVHQIK